MALDYSEKFAAIVPVCGGMSYIDLPFMESIRNLPIWAFYVSGENVIMYHELVFTFNKVNFPGGRAKLLIQNSTTGC